MLHQLLFALIGHPGDIIKLTNQSMKIQGDTKFLSDAQKKLINSISVLGYYYRNIEEYIGDVCIAWSKIESKTNEDEEDNSKSIYLRTFCGGLNQVLAEYKEELVTIERNFLEKRFFTYAEIQAELTKYFSLFPELWAIITKIQQENLKGGMLLNLLTIKIKSSTSRERKYFQLIFQRCYKAMYNQICSWILYGKLLSNQHQFFIHKVQTSSSTKVEKDWDSMYTLESNMIPSTIIDHETAYKILFIGKGAIILRMMNKELSKLADHQLVMKVTKLQNFDPYTFNTIIEEIRYSIAHQLMEMIMGKENLMKQLDSLKEYYLMSKGDFFYTFLEESQSILSLPYSKKAEQNLNGICLPNTFTRIGQQPNPKVSLQVKQNGFTFTNFSNTVNLTILGNVSVRPSQYIKFQPVKNYGGSLWHNIKQPVESGFTTRVTFRFKKAVYGSMVSFNATLPSSRARVEQQISSTSICYVIQNSNEISSWKKNAPISLSEVVSGVSVRVGMEETIKKSQGKSFVIVSYVHNGQERVLDKIQFKKNSMKGHDYLDFSQQDFHQIKIYYSNDILKVSFSQNHEQDSKTLSINIKLNKYLELDMGRAYMGFLQSSLNSCYSVDILKWQVLGINAFNTSDYWGDLTINYEINWPINLIISNQLIEKYQQLFRMFFPIRHTQIELDKMWLKLQRKAKFVKKSLYPIVMAFCGFRSQLSQAINTIWTSFQQDIVDFQWERLKEQLQMLDDFEKLRLYLDSYVKAMENMCFLTIPRVVRSIYDIIKSAKDFINLYHEMEADEGETNYNYQKEFIIIKKKYSEAYRVLVVQLTTLFDSSNSKHINQLLLKLDFNHYYDGEK